MTSLLDEIQTSLLDQDQGVATALMKFKLLASRLGSRTLEQWVKFELEGYPSDAELPDYRRVGIHYLANFSGPFGSGVKNAPIPSIAIEKYAGDHWNTFQLRQSISGIDALIVQTDEGVLRLAMTNLIYVLQGNVYPDMACNSVTGLISKASLLEVTNAVRTRMLDLTIELERQVPESLTVEARTRGSASNSSGVAVNNITHQIIHGQVTTINNSGDGNTFTLTIQQNDSQDVVRALEEAGIVSRDARAFADLLKAERPEAPAGPFGPKAKAWIAKNIQKAIDGTWSVGIATAAKVLEQAALRYYGLS